MRVVGEGSRNSAAKVTRTRAIEELAHPARIQVHPHVIGAHSPCTSTAGRARGVGAAVALGWQ